MIIRLGNNMRKFEPLAYNITDFLEWKERDQLVLVPKFQRRSVWNPVAKSYLIDSIIREVPLPKIFIRQVTDIETRTTIREVIDGQQRLRTIFEFIDDGFSIRPSHNDEYGGMKYSQLPEEIQGNILSYKLSVDNLVGLDDSEIMDIFARLNTYSVKLNSQELLNAKYFGHFKKLVYSIGHRYNKFWSDNKIFTDYQIMRMNEVELTADLIIAMVDEVQTRKNAKTFYAEYEDEFEERVLLSEKFDEVISIIVKVFGERLRTSVFKKPALFYSLFLVTYAIKNSLVIDSKESEICMGIDSINPAKLSNAIDIVESIVNESKDTLTKEEIEFVDSISKKTSDTSVRQFRTRFIYNIFKQNLVS